MRFLLLNFGFGLDEGCWKEFVAWFMCSGWNDCGDVCSCLNVAVVFAVAAYP